MFPRALLALLTLFLVSPALTRAATALRPNFLVIISDDQRPDTIRALGNPNIRTPALDRLVRQGVAFTRATCANPHCVPSRAEILTGTTGFRNGVLNASGKFHPNTIFWAQTLREAGYMTWYSGKWMNDGKPQTRGYHHIRGLFSSGGSTGKAPSNPTDHKGAPVTGYSGWTFKDDASRPDLSKGVGLTPDTSRHIADAAIGVLRATGQEPFFLHINFTAPHDPLLVPRGLEKRLNELRVPAPENFSPEHPFDHGNLRGRDELLLPFPRTPSVIQRELAAYYAVIEDMDAQIGRILDALDTQQLRERTVVIFSSDHGLALGSHGLMGKQNQYEHTIGVPLLMAGPGIPRGKLITGQCHLRDLFPTTCELGGIAIPASVTGRSLVPLLQDSAPGTNPRIYGYWQDVQRMIRNDTHKLIAYPKARRWQLFDVKSDPHELNNLVGAENAKSHETRLLFDSLRSELLQWLEGETDPLLKELTSLPGPW